MVLRLSHKWMVLRLSHKWVLQSECSQIRGCGQTPERVLQHMDSGDNRRLPQHTDVKHNQIQCQRMETEERKGKSDPADYDWDFSTRDPRSHHPRLLLDSL